MDRLFTARSNKWFSTYEEAYIIYPTIPLEYEQIGKYLDMVFTKTELPSLQRQKLQE